MPAECDPRRGRGGESKGTPATTGSIPKYNTIGDVLAGADGLDEEDEEASDAPKSEPVKASSAKKSLFNFSGWSMFGKSSMSGSARPDPGPAASH